VGQIWIGTGGGLSVYSPGADKGSGKFRNYTTRNGLPDNIVISLVEDMNGVIWIGTVKEICRFINGAISPPGFKQKSLPIHALFEDRKGDLWFSDLRGLSKVSGDKTFHYSTRDGLIF